MESPYSMPFIYEMAFSFRDYESAVDFLVDACSLEGMKEIDSVVELGCGPAQFCREFSKRGICSYGIDNSSEMVAYATERASIEKLENCSIQKADFRDFDLDRLVDLAICMNSTFHHNETNADAVATLESVANNLKTGGIFILEMVHPKDILSNRVKVAEVRSRRPTKASYVSQWRVRHGDYRLVVDWGKVSLIDPVTEVVSFDVTYYLTHNKTQKVYKSPSTYRAITAGHMEALIELPGCFTIINRYGSLETSRPFDNHPESWRMIYVLRKV